MKSRLKSRVKSKPKSRTRSNTDIPAIQPVHWDKPRLKEILAATARKRVLVIGDVGVDRYTQGLVERISPEAPVPILQVQEETFKLGLAANVADNVKTLGGVPLLVGLVGKDRAAQDFKDLLRATGISVSHLISDSSRRTVVKERVVSERQQLLRIDYESSHGISAAVESSVATKIRKLVSACDVVILEDYAKGLITPGLASLIFAAAKKAGKWVAVDPNSKTPVSVYRGATVLTPNTKEAEALSGISIRSEDSLRAAGRRILDETGAKYVVITRGKEGMAIFSSATHSVSLIPTYAREVYDVSGAGDTVISVLSLAFASGASIEEAAVLGNLAAGVEVAKRGTATVSPEEILVALEFFGAVGI